MTAKMSPKPWQREALRGLVLPGYEDLDPAGLPWEDAAAKRPLEGEHSVAKRSRSRLVIRIEHEGETLYVKRALARTLPRVVSAFLLGPKTFREWRTAHEWLDQGLRVPEPVLVASQGKRLSYLVTRGLPESWTPLNEWLKTNGLDLEMLKDVGRLARALHDRPAYHADYRTDHIYRTDAPADAPLFERFAFIDLDGAFIGKPVSTEQRRQALVQFLVSLKRRDASVEHAAALVAGYEEASPIGLDPAALFKLAAST
ncbi:lipopolysaccharide kinase InaA family protein [bacterium]|nr:lipopolysaccharide kinase InaA family protein [bacterium]